MSEPLKRLAPAPDGPSRLAKNASLRELDPRIFDPNCSIADRQAFLRAVKRRQWGRPE